MQKMKLYLNIEPKPICGCGVFLFVWLRFDFGIFRKNLNGNMEMKLKEIKSICLFRIVSLSLFPR